MPARVISIGTTHPQNIAGVGLDIAIGQLLGIEVFTVIAGVSAQDDTGVTALHSIPAQAVRAQLTAACSDKLSMTESCFDKPGVTECHPEPVEGRAGTTLRIGALVTAANVRAIAEFIRAHPEIPAVVDPVITSSAGGRLLEDDAIEALREDLATLPSVILTPNLDEAAILLACTPIERDGLADAAKDLQSRGCRAVVLKGGHLTGEPIDALATAAGVELLPGERIAATMRGTGCTLAMAMACELARGLPLREALEFARAFVKGRLESAAKATASL